MRQLRHGCFPHIFAWRGREYRVEAVERCWTVSPRGRGGRVEGHCFRVRVWTLPGPRPEVRPEGSVEAPSPAEARREATFHLFQDTRAGTWHVQRRAR